MKKHIFVLLLTLVCLLLNRQAFCQQSTGSDIGNHMDAAENYMLKEKWDFACYEWRNVLEEDPKNLTAHLGLVEALVKSGNIQDAIDHLNVARTKIKSPLLDMNLAQTYEQNNQFQQAMELYQSILKDDPGNSEVISALVKLLPKLSAEPEATLQKQLADIKTQAKNQAQLALKKAQYNDAAKSYEIATLYQPTTAELNDYGLSLMLAGRYSLAATKFGQLYSSQQAPCEVRPNAAMSLLSIGKPKEAARLMQEVLNTCPSPTLKPRFYNNLGYIYEIGRDWNKALGAYEQASQLDAQFDKATLNLAFVNQELAHYDKAISIYKDMLTRNPNNVQAWTKMGYVEELQHHSKLAIADYKKAISLDPSYPDAYYNLAALYRNQDKADKANEVTKQASMVQQASSSLAPLFKYVDLFFAEPVLQ